MAVIRVSVCHIISSALCTLRPWPLQYRSIGLQEPFLLMSFGFILKSLIGLYNKHWQLAWVNYCVRFCNKTITELFVSTARTDKKKRKFSSYIRKFRVDQLQSHIWLTASSYMGKYLRISSYIRKPFLIYDCSTMNFPIYEENLIFFFISAASSYMNAWL